MTGIAAESGCFCLENRRGRGSTGGIEFISTWRTPMKTGRSMLALACVALWSAAVVAADWPQWRGPRRDGISAERGLLKQWPAEGPRLVWQAKDIGDGYSTPSVVGDRLYVLSNKGMDDEFVQALDTKDGRPIW